MTAPLGFFARTVIAAYADGSLPGFLAARVQRRLSTDEAWARAYHARRILERALVPSSLSSAQVATLIDRVLPRAAAPPQRRTAPVLAFAGVVACAAVAVIAVVRNNDNLNSDELHARGSTDAKVALHVRCVDAARKAVLGEADVKSGATLSCPKTGLLAFSVTNTSAHLLWLTGVAVSDAADNATLFTLPFDGDTAITVAAGSVDVALTRGYPLDAAPSRLRLNADLVMTMPAAPQAGGPALVVEVTP